MAAPHEAQVARAIAAGGVALMLSRIFRPLDRYIFGEFFKIFFGTALGLPVLVVIIDLVDNLEKYLTRQIPRGDIALSYLYYLPESAFMVVPAAVLFATVFCVGALTRHAEITAAKASGMSFYRLIVPIFVGATIAFAIDLALGELMPVTTRKRNELLRDVRMSDGQVRNNFAFASELGRVYKVSQLLPERGSMSSIQIERKGVDDTYPTYLLSAEEAKYDSTATPGRHWRLTKGQMNVVGDTGTSFMITFDSGYDTHFAERPQDMMRAPRSPQEMRYAELTRFIRAAERSGTDVNTLRVERMLKIAIPAACIIIALFGAPLATSNQRGGAAYGIAVSLGTTIIFLLAVNLTKGFGGKGLMTPEIAAWIPGIAFGVIGLILLARVRT
jgi:lipopolysaccharide export system permease protein